MQLNFKNQNYVYLPARHQLFNHRQWHGREVIHSVVGKVEQQKHSGDKHLLVLVTHDVPDHETCPLDVLNLFDRSSNDNIILCNLENSLFES